MHTGIPLIMYPKDFLFLVLSGTYIQIFYTKKDLERILKRMEEAAILLRSGHIDQLPSHQKERLRKTFAVVAEDESDLTYKDAMLITADFYDEIVLWLRKMEIQSIETDTFCVMAP